MPRASASLRFLVVLCALATHPVVAQQTLTSEDGYELWLRYKPVSNAARLAEYRAAATQLVVPGSSPTLAAARDELLLGLTGLLGRSQTQSAQVTQDGAIVVVTPATANLVRGLAWDPGYHSSMGDEGYIVDTMRIAGKRTTVIAGPTDAAALYGAFGFLRSIQTNQRLRRLIVATPNIRMRLLNHWDNVDRSVERGYAGPSLWDWEHLPDSLPRRYRDYARANASIGINGVALTNVNANARVLTAEYLRKVAALASVFRPYGIRVYLTARFSAPIEIGGLRTADPLDPAVRSWWKSKADEIWRMIPDFGGFLVKANSEGQPGPQDYKRTHADGANMLADAVAPHGGVVMWRAFVYSNDVPVDRVKQAYDEFTPLDGKFRANVLIQTKNGPLDFQPREPFHPLFGAMPHSQLMMEVQITKEYLGQDTHLVFLAPYFEEVLWTDTWARGRNSTVSRVVDGAVHGYARTGMAGVANIGADRNWTGSQFNQANWYAYGRLAWDPTLRSAEIADEWIRMTFTNDAAAVARIREMMLMSREAVVNYMTPLGLAHIMATGHHYGPGAWADAGRADWTPSYYHRADTLGVGFDRTATGSNAVGQYAVPVRDRFASRDSTPDNLLLWFHRVRWTDTVKSSRTVWNELVHRYNEGVDSVRSMQRTWESVRPFIDQARFNEVRDFLVIQEAEARWWRDASLQYFQTFSRQPIPPTYEQPAHPLTFYQSLRCPKDPRKPRCPEIN